ncbi:MAG: SCO family protein [Ignavibacteriae bacterium HGW-Ignavibacteriae-3]|nr:MAG: SCO family protein [Ignavibacteriae bacterium HGW-Ignavibacteriae-3]
MNLLKNYVIVFLLVISSVLSAQKKIEVGIDEQLGATIPMDLKFRDSGGDTVLLKDLIKKPTLLAFIYYECPGICNPLQTELAWTIDKIQLEPGKDFKVISISFDHTETPAIAAKWKKNYLLTIKRKFDPADWIFLTGDSLSVRTLTEACGFYFKPEDKEFIHAATLVTVTPTGKISRYIFGTQFNPFDVKMALLEAESGKTSPTISKVLQYCFSYDPEGRKYTLNVTRIVGAVMLLGIGLFLGVLLIKKKKTGTDSGTEKTDS